MRGQRQGQRQTDERQDGARGRTPSVPRAERAHDLGRAGGPGPRSMLALQQSAGNSRATRAMRPGTANSAAAPGGPGLGTVPEAAERGLTLPPYLLGLQAPGLSSTYGLTGHEFVRTVVAGAVARADGTVAEIAAELAARPETFYGRGRAFAVEGGEGRGWFDVTVTISPATDERPPEIEPAALARAQEDATKVDVHHNSAAAVGSSSGGSTSYGAGGTFFGLAPVAPGLYLGGVGMAQAQPWQSSQESRSQKGVAEPRVLRSESGSVEVPRRVRYGVRIRQQDAAAAPPVYGTGTLTMRVPTESLVPYDTAAPPPVPRVDDPALARRVRHAGSLAPVAVTDDAGPRTDDAGPHAGGGGLFDAVASVLHPSLTEPGSPGRARLYAATSSTAVLEDMPRLLGNGVVSDDLTGPDPRTAGAYRMSARIAGLAPGWAAGQTQLRTHAHAQHTAADAAGKGRSGAIGAGPAVGVGVAMNAAVARAGAMPTAAARKARFTQYDQTTARRVGAEVRGDKVLYLATVDLTVEGTGTSSANMLLGRASRVARHSLRMWMTLRADEAQDLGLPLPPGVSAGPLVTRPKRRREGAAGDQATEEDVERHLPFGAMGASVALDRLDTTGMIASIERMFAADPRLEGFLPPFGDKRKLGTPAAEAQAQRHNYQELVTRLSETNLKANKDQLLSTGVPVRLRRKSRMHAHDVQIRVTGTLGDAEYAGDIEKWLVRSHSGVSSNLQSGRSSSRSAGWSAIGQVRIVPGVLTGSARRDRNHISSRRNQAGPTTRSDVLTNGSEDASVFSAPLNMQVQITMTHRQRKARRSVLPGSPGRDVPEPERIARMDVEQQDVRLVTPTEFTLDGEEKRRLDDDGAARGARQRGPEWRVDAAGIGDLAALTPRPASGRALRNWTLVETVGSGAPIRDLAFDLLAGAAARDKGVREDRALGTEGLAPRQAIEERLGPGALTGALRQAVSSGWVVKNLKYPRRLAALDGAVGMRLALTNPRVTHEGSGPGTETFLLGGHQAGGQEGRGTTTTYQGGLMGLQNGAEWRTGQGAAVTRSKGESTAGAVTVSGTVERNSHTPRKAPLYLVRCDLLVTMVAEVKVTGGGPYVTKEARTLPGEVGVWLTAEQLSSQGLRLPKSAAEALGMESVLAPRPDPAGAGAEGSRRAGGRPADRQAGAPLVPPADPARTPARPVPDLDARLPLGMGMIENLPNFVPLLAELRAALARRDKSLAADLLPRRQLDDPNDNVQRLLRVLDRDGSEGLLSSAMDGGVTVELFDGRRTPYWAVFRVRRAGPGRFAEMATDKRDMEYITSATAQRTDSQEQGGSLGAEGVLAGSAKPEGGAGVLKSTGGVAGLGAATADSQRTGSASRAQVGMKLVADSATAPAKMRVPVDASLELHSAKGRVALAQSGRKELVHRVPKDDLTALARLEPVTARPAGERPPAAADADPARLGAWRDGGVRLPLEAQVNGFQGAPQVRQLVDAAVKEAGGGRRYRDTGQSAAYTLQEAVSTEWLISALPLLTNAGAELPPVHASGLQGQDLHASVHARLRAGKVLGTGAKMSFEAIAPSGPEGPRPTQEDGQYSADRGRAGRGLFGAGLLNATEFRLNQALANADSAGGAADMTANGSGSMPVHKPKQRSVLVQFTVDVRVVARVVARGTHRTGTAVRELTLPAPVVVRMPEPVARRLLAETADDSRLRAAEGRLAPADPQS
ncbi:hypothetical protein RI578_22150 [Streptomyces sp. BB1-1-1]|uniref:hypothetical protein n=1 Tax=Streptomyces sp. BB1-1-1 TaxID=3074430 RepID=UPI002877B0E9|nr:hypothetical protein [Streptomyces sp. BB1-1-1]WND36814.1 hypothetical protein RI578_22150 [Streptomyces sp. BB1-1-1]